MGVHDGFWGPVLAGIGAPITPWNEISFENWALHEGNETHRFWANNPFASTQNGNLDTSFNIGYGPGVWNSAGVKVYADQASGIAATVATILDGWYPNIIRCFRDQTPYPEAAHDWFIWINGPNADPKDPKLTNYGPDVLAFMRSNTASKMRVLSADERITRLENIVAGYGIRDADWNLLSGEAALAYADTKQFSAILAAEIANRAVAQLINGDTAAARKLLADTLRNLASQLEATT